MIKRMDTVGGYPDISDVRILVDFDGFRDVEISRCEVDIGYRKFGPRNHHDFKNWVCFGTNTKSSFVILLLIFVPLAASLFPVVLKIVIF